MPRELRLARVPQLSNHRRLFPARITGPELLSWLAVTDGEPLLWELRKLGRSLSQEPAGSRGVFVGVHSWGCVRARARVCTDTRRDHALSRGMPSPQGGEIGSYGVKKILLFFIEKTQIHV